MLANIGEDIGEGISVWITGAGIRLTHIGGLLALATVIVGALERARAAAFPACAAAVVGCEMGGAAFPVGSTGERRLPTCGPGSRCKPEDDDPPNVQVGSDRAFG